MKLTRRNFSRLAGSGVLAAAAPALFASALAQDKPLRIGIIAPRSGAAGTAGECGIRAVQWAAERMNKDGGIAGRRIELVFEEETNPKDTIERLRRRSRVRRRTMAKGRDDGSDLAYCRP